jgi:uncharacterized protein involved in exopolysaccharide biosynthesis
MKRTADGPMQLRNGDPPGPRELLAVLARRKWLILLVALPIIAASALYSYTRTPLYSSSAGILVRPTLTSLTSAAGPQELEAQTEMNLATSVAVATVAQELMGSFVAPEQLLAQVSASMVNGTQYLTISFTDADAAAAQRGAEAFADAYLEYRQQYAEEVLQQQVAASNTQAQRDALNGITTDPGRVVDPATLPTSPATPRHDFDIAIGVLLGLSLGFAVALIRERRSDAARAASRENWR